MNAVPFPDVLALLEALVRHRVGFVVIGGVAVVQHGFSRTTRDLDIVPEPAAENADRLWDALVELEARPAELPGLRQDEHAVAFSRGSLADGGSWELETSRGLLHVLQHVAGMLESPEDYARLHERAEPIVYEFGTVRYAGYRDLIDLKYLAGREQDLIDIRALEEARGTAGPED
jgi:Nucleotidyltransferase of unknown function (DUF6036)